MHPFLTQLRSGLNRCEVAGARLLVAVSGGADSVALLRGLVEASSEFALELFVAHLNHHLRGADSDADAVWVQTLAATLKLPIEVGEILNADLSAETSGLEEKARTVRYEFLEQVATKFDCAVIALAHTADDQSETVLHHLFRGTGIAGLRGIPAVRPLASGSRLVRPLLRVRRGLIEEYLQDCRQPFRIDQTNSDTAMTRNKLRHVVLPMLREQVNPQLDLALCRLAEQAHEIDEILSQQAEQMLASCLKDRDTESCRLDVSPLHDRHRHLIREMFRAVWQLQDWPRQAMGFDQWNRLAEMLVTRKPIILPNRIEARFHSENLLVLRRL